ncbi:MAG TPA: hypothetical protein VFT42_02200 [Solirubrobacteraceae bacterium]|nr:hypothetical protein [Solirubrobacteraceae bacterium]
MRPTRMRTGEWTALAGAVALVVFLSLRWFGASAAAGGRAGIHESGWASLGWGIVLLLAIGIAGALALSAVTSAGATAAFPMLAAVVTAPLAIVAWIVLALRLAFFQPTLGVGLPSEAVAVRWPAYAALAALALLLYGACRAMSDERLDDPESAYTPPPPRPAPPAAGGTLSA